MPFRCVSAAKPHVAHVIKSSREPYYSKSISEKSLIFCERVTFEMLNEHTKPVGKETAKSLVFHVAKLGTTHAKISTITEHDSYHTFLHFPHKNDST